MPKNEWGYTTAAWNKLSPAKKSAARKYKQNEGARKKAATASASKAMNTIKNTKAPVKKPAMVKTAAKPKVKPKMAQIGTIKGVKDRVAARKKLLNK